jgi:hypothetical protein
MTLSQDLNNISHRLLDPVWIPCIVNSLRYLPTGVSTSCLAVLGGVGVVETEHILNKDFDLSQRDEAPTDAGPSTPTHH